MSFKGIVIQWDHGKEVIQFDPDNPMSVTDVTKTSERWEEESKTVTYKVESRCREASGRYHIALEYKKEDNPEVGPFWGTLKIDLKKGARTGKAVWQGSHDKKPNEPAEWSRLDRSVLGEGRQIEVNTTKWYRMQSTFRQELLAMGAVQCAISGETTEAALEAAHIVGVTNGGRESVCNGILLRVDLHRLYDAGKFKIERDGTLTITGDGLSDDYRELLSNKTIDKKVMSRIREALQEKERLEAN
ncbi:HNH endonuclease signature motif containing protein [Sansalvadorimonas verongulae]|uniref:HNH endonuclease signature motif containing protein n=1 Tax=Sansalvadorimonas verongulae TaxID=2172824 RepID=UPI0012BBC8B0|nr:HNH endonuclease signature motif containing protein [Sansalvadorimonas verongulae]MTI12155.1 HNH endonuclease [Sansalvadorimonas verongulae]